jgi:RTX calcium-binding nonapeptide repeat (4 copies)
LLARTTKPVTVLLAALAVVAVNHVAAQATMAQHTGRDATVATSADRAARFERWATITKIPGGYYYDAGQQNSNLLITSVSGGVRFHDTRTDVVRSKPDSCRKKHSARGIVVVCRVPGSVSVRNPMTIKVFTRLGNDTVDASALPASMQLYGLADAGRDVFKGGAGDDFINGAQGRDRIWGGPGNDWLRGNLGDDDLYGGPGHDQLVGVDGHDRIRGGRGNDRVGGGPANDRLFAGAGDDFILCGTGSDNASADRTDRVMQDCESISRR